VYVYRVDEAGTPRMMKSPSWCGKCRSGFTTLPSTPLLEQLVVVHLLERA
jgi:hypothetical protein